MQIIFESRSTDRSHLDHLSVEQMHFAPCRQAE